MKAAGFKTLNLSLGSISEAQLRRFNRPDVREAFDNVLILAEKYSLNAVGYVIVGAPFQSAEDSLSDLIFPRPKKSAFRSIRFLPGSRQQGL